MPAFGLDQRQRLARRERDALKQREARTRARGAAKARQQPSGNAAQGNGARGSVAFQFFPSRLSFHGISFLRLGLMLQRAVKPPA
jgi:hypothetical protein